METISKFSCRALFVYESKHERFVECVFAFISTTFTKHTYTHTDTHFYFIKSNYIELCVRILCRHIFRIRRIQQISYFKGKSCHRNHSKTNFVSQLADKCFGRRYYFTMLNRNRFLFSSISGD